MTEGTLAPPLSLARSIAGRYGALPQVEAVALAGSQATGSADQGSDIDLYVYLNAPLPVALRARIATASAQYAEVDNRFWEPGDEWLDEETGIHVDVMLRTVDWIEEQLDRVLRRHEASVGYSTCLWYNVVSSQPLFDRAGWFQQLQEATRQPYPEGLRRAIVAKNHPILRRTASSYRYQLAGAAARDDRVSINHRVAALLASYFDILFAINRIPHPGEKRLLERATEQCAQLPQGMERQVKELIEAVSRGKYVVEKADALVDGLDNLLSREGFEVPSNEQ
ncbi:MAG: nucleotidyltransferase domain-containing protein [Anaerolineae bacterium]|jgi:predicted nucleotidyltransferase